MKFTIYPICLFLILNAGNCSAEDDAQSLSQKGIEALRESQTNPKAIVDAARYFARAIKACEQSGQNELLVENNSYLYWCRKKMTLEDIEALNKSGDNTAIGKFEAVETQKVEVDKAQEWLKRVEAFAQSRPTEHFLIAVRYFEVADRFKGSDASLTAQDRSLKEMQQVLNQRAAAPLQPITHAQPATPVSERLPIPPAAAVQEAEKLLKSVFKEDYAKATPADRIQLAGKFMQQGSDQNAQPAERFAQLREARELALSIRDTGLALKAIQQMGKVFEYDATTESIPIVQRFIDTASKEEFPGIVDVCLRLLRDAVTTEAYEKIPAIVRLCDSSAQRSGINFLATMAREQTADANEVYRAWASNKQSFATLEKNTADPAANLVAGRFYCFRAGNFEKGIPFLAKSSDAALKALSLKDSAGAADAQEQAALGDAWWDFSEKDLKQNGRGRERAGHWYKMALPGLAGLQKVRVEKRVETLKAQLAASSGIFRVKNPQWISKGATYTVSSILTTSDFKPLPYFLTGNGRTYTTPVAGDVFSFHTMDEQNPHAIVDLGALRLISNLEIGNRKHENYIGRARTLAVWTAKDKEGPWTEVWRANEAALVWKVPLESAVLARYVKLGLLSFGPLHLLSVKVFGE